MQKEMFFKFIFIILSVLFGLFTALVGLWFGEIYLIFLLMLVVVVFMYICLELYLRIQHNISSSKSSLADHLYQDIKLLIEKIEYDQKNMIKKIDDVGNIDSVLDQQNDVIKRMVAGLEDLYESQYEQTIDLVRDSQKEVELLKKEIIDIVSKKKK